VPLVRILPEAEADVDAQAEYYESRRTPDTAERWYRQTTATFRRLAASPWIGEKRHSGRREFVGVRLATVIDFPGQVVVYREFPAGSWFSGSSAAGRT
jgi:plasmid stabilization system protein ParE